MAPSKPTTDIPAETLAAYDQLVAAFPGIERKGAGLPYTSLNGNMFSFLDKEGRLSLRLSKEDRETFLERYPDSISMQHGVVMKEYVLVPEALFLDMTGLKSWFERSYANAQRLKAKTKEK